MATQVPEKPSGSQPADADIPEDIFNATPDEINSRTRLIDNELRILKNEINRLNQESKSMKEQVKENNEKIKLNKQLPYLVANVVEVRFCESFGVSFGALSK
jgi:ATP-dependent 26S proteasome regulatory subunit